MTIGAEERAAVDRVMSSGRLSGFIGAWCDEFGGGPEIGAFEAVWREKFGVKHAISVNSNTSGMIAAMGAVGVGPGDEVIVPPYTMSATAMAPLFYGGIPVFADIEPDTYCLDVASVRAAITPRTRAILIVNLFGHPARLHELRALADEHGIALVEDNAQSPLATEYGRYTGAVGHIGVFSLNYHKHFHTGEGGVCITDDDNLALRLKMIRNHGENVVDPLAVSDLTNIVGFNFRMTELSAAIGVKQLDKSERLVAGREAMANKLSNGVQGLPGLTPPVVREDCRHVYYVWGARYDASVTGVSRATLAKALNAEGVPTGEGYVEPLYMLPLFQKRIAIGREGFPFNLTNRHYGKGLCPIAERLYEKEMLEFWICSYDLTDLEQQAAIDAYHKVFENLPALADFERKNAQA
jgi:dTDP-4-amino-4,6-dideoxygalactose transaminase